MATLSFPMKIENGRWKIVRGQEEAEQLVKALMKTAPGELPLSRTYGVWVEYNVTHETVREAQRLIREAFAGWYPSLTLGEISPVFGEAGEVVDWRIEVRYDPE